MKTLFSIAALTLALSAVAAPPPGCYMQASTLGEVAGEISEVVDTKAWVTPALKNGMKKCIVTFRGKAKDRWLSGTGEYAFPSSMADDQACEIALNNGRIALAEQVYGKKVVKAEQLVCSDFPQEENKPSVKVGEIIALSQVRPHPTKKEPFGYRGAECRYFTETDIERNFYIYTGVVCSVGNGRWTVVDKW